MTEKEWLYYLYNGIKPVNAITLFKKRQFDWLSLWDGRTHLPTHLTGLLGQNELINAVMTEIKLTLKWNLLEVSWGFGNIHVYY